jgi:L-serine dehydratase
VKTRRGPPSSRLGRVSLLDVIGPVMVGPSSSHTAGACRLALLARGVLGGPAEQARFELHGSFAKTAHGHGTELALIAGSLGFAPDDPRIPHARDEAERAGLDVSFSVADLGDVHPNSVRITLRSGEREHRLAGSSLGGGLVRVYELDGFALEVSGRAPALLVRHRDTPGAIARVTRVIADDEINVATLHSARQRRGGEAMMSIEMDRPLSEIAFGYLEHLPFVSWMRRLPEVMSATSDGAHVEAATSGSDS